MLWGGVEGGTEKTTPQNGSLQLDLNGTGFPKPTGWEGHSRYKEQLMARHGGMPYSGLPGGQGAGPVSAGCTRKKCPFRAFSGVRAKRGTRCTDREHGEGRRQP